MRKTPVTSGAECVGSALINLFVDDGYRVQALDDFSLSDPSNLIGRASYEFVRGDVRDVETIGAATEDGDSSKMWGQGFTPETGLLKGIADLVHRLRTELEARMRV